MNDDKRGIRHRYRELMDPIHFNFPKKTLLNHRIEWYLDGSALAKPTNGVYAMACFAEYVMHFARFGKKTQKSAVQDAARFYAATRSALQNTLSTYRIDSRLTGDEILSLRVVVSKLVEEANHAYGNVMLGKARVKCPCCHESTLARRDAKLLEAILFEQSRNGTIPPTSELYRSEPLTP